MSLIIWKIISPLYHCPQEWANLSTKECEDSDGEGGGGGGRGGDERRRGGGKEEWEGRRRGIEKSGRRWGGGGGGQSKLNGSLACCPGCLDLA